MGKRNLIICAAQYVHVDGGYLSRILSEIDKLLLKYNIYMFIPQGSADKNVFGEQINIIKYSYINKNDLCSYFRNVKACKTTFKKTISKINNPIIYCEALVGSMWILEIARKAHLQIVFDCHGTEADEFLMLQPTIKRVLYAYVLKYFEKKIVKMSSLIVTVSNKQYQKWGIEKRHVKYPMVPATQFFDAKRYRQEIRKKLDIPINATVFVYSGGAAIWQMCDETMGLYKKIETMDSNSFLLVLTGRQDVFKPIIAKYSIENYRICTVKYDDMPKYLDAADYGFCIRANHIVNNVASPTKILEYLARDVKPIITDCIGDFSEELGKLGLACIMNDSLDNIDDIIRSEGFDGAGYVGKTREEYVENYTNALGQL